MVDIWDDFSSEVENQVTGQDGFTADFYIDNVPDDSSLPYALLLEGSIENWMTFANSTAGEIITFRVVLTNSVRGGGADELKDQATEVVKALHLQDFSTDDFETVGCKRTRWVQPFKVSEDSTQWKQYVDFEANIQYKSGSEYFNDFDF